MIPKIKPKTESELQKTQQEIDHLHRFYTLKFKYTEKAGHIFEGIKFENVKFVDLLKDFGFFRYDIGSSESKFVRIEDNKIEDVTEDQIIDFVEKYVKDIPPRTYIHEYIGEIIINKEMILQKLYDCLDILFKRKLLGRLNPENPIKIMEDFKHEKYFFFRNKFVKVTAANIYVGDYSEITKSIWKDNVLERDYIQGDGVTGVFEKFVRRICGEVFEGEKNYINFKPQVFEERFLSLKTYIGYLLHSYYKGKLRAIAFTDSSNEEDESNGRTGKTMLVRSLVKMLQYKQDDKEDKSASVYAEIAGKSFDIRDVHKYSKVKLDTKIVHINDLPRYFQIEALFNDISDGCQAKDLYQSKFVVMAKFVLSTNYMIKIVGESAKDRIRFFEIANHYNANYSPDMEFGHWFFEDWENEKAIEWLRFNDFMISCTQEYFKNGLIEAKSINLVDKELKEFTNKDFYMWIENRLKERTDDGEPTDLWLRITKADEMPERYDKKALFDAYIKDFKDSMTQRQKNDFTQRKLIKWIKYYFSKKHPEVQISETTSGGIYWISFSEMEVTNGI